ncbi:MAG: hypothetical protein A2934_02170 [Candidatus Sungbacteria bacterium RIFCSPLOWO2_01_FULL_47_10]|uniref:Uncharacterized protein n=1 Tax=Candidatus Sungbacteria bacterium RIFCSPLOWO2_01_FULL_47_10 TaxID=1802276 RepID=A0A1G2L669_9BACT|nr:MAG: hypothetical protein A2934_02170 [Candidatus Sungbacteria bacterium RIFCSPLOWO2_01_FULL_47_10]
MAWWQAVTEFLRSSNPYSYEAPSEPLGWKDSLRRVAIGAAIDWLYFLLGFFTHFYFWSLAFLFFFQEGGYWVVTAKLLDAVSGPYLISVGVYVVLKEVRKRKISVESRHFGELYVSLWAILLAIGSILVITTESYRFDSVMELIIANSLAVVIMYTAGKIHRP